MAVGPPLKLRLPKTAQKPAGPQPPVLGGGAPGARLDPARNRADDDLYQKQPTPPKEPAAPHPSTAPGVGFSQRLAQLMGRHPIAVAAIVAASMLPGLVGVPLVSPVAATEQIQISAPLARAFDAQRTAAQAAVATSAEEVPNLGFIQHRSELATKLQAMGVPLRADGVVVRVASDSKARGQELLQIIAHPLHGLAPGADVLLFGAADAVYSPRHQTIIDAFKAETGRIEAGAEPTTAWLMNAAVSELLDSAELVHQASKRDGGSKDAAELLVLDRSHSPRSLAQDLLPHLESAPAGSPAADYLKKLGQTADERLEGLAKGILAASDTETGGRTLRLGARALTKEFDEARAGGLLVLRPAGDQGRADDSLKNRLSRDFAHGIQSALTVAATGPIAADGTASPLPSTAGGWLNLSAPGTSLWIDGELPPSSTALGYAASTAALMLKALPNLSPTQLDALLSDARGLKDTPGPRDGLGVVHVPALVLLAKEAGLGQVRFAADPARFAFEKALKGEVFAAADHPYLVHVQHLRSELAAKGLPTRADGVKIVVIEPKWGEHGSGVVRTIAHEQVGLAPGADVLLWTDSQWYDAREKALSKSSVADADAVLNGAAPKPSSVINEAERMILGRAADIRRVATFASGEETVLLNMSYGTTSASIAENLHDVLLDAPAGSEAASFLTSMGSKKSEQIENLTKHVATVLESPEARSQLADAQKDLATELRAARDKRVLAFTSAGNAREPWVTRSSHSEHVEAGQPDLITVGATSIGNPRKLSDDRITDFSSDGHVFLSAPGDDLPVGVYGDIDGTSFASPYSVAAAALMLSANRDLTPDQLEELLFHPSATQDIAGHLDGLGVLDVVAAVSLAEQAKSPSFVFASSKEAREAMKEARLSARRGDHVPPSVTLAKPAPQS